MIVINKNKMYKYPQHKYLTNNKIYNHHIHKIYLRINKYNIP